MPQSGPRLASHGIGPRPSLKAWRYLSTTACRLRSALRVDDPGELDKQAVAGGFDNAASMLADFGIDLFATMRRKPREGAFFVGTHKPAVTRDVRGENGGQPAIDASRGQSRAP